MPIQQIAPIVKVQQAKLEKERHEMEDVLRGMKIAIQYSLVLVKGYKLEKMSIIEILVTY